ncbi:unnamed protein product [Closterium sp. NIES-65]|nr:unnamed protein product [Closterium sp. NIES-65]
MERRLLDRLDDVEKELRRSRARSASPSAPRAAPVVPLSVLLPHNPFGSPARSERPLPAGIGFVGAGGGPPWAQFAPPRSLPAPRDLAVSSHCARASALLPPMKEVPTATLARLWSLAASLQSLERILQESFDSMPDMWKRNERPKAVEDDDEGGEGSGDEGGSPRGERRGRGGGGEGEEEDALAAAGLVDEEEEGGDARGDGNDQGAPARKRRRQLADSDEEEAGGGAERETHVVGSAPDGGEEAPPPPTGEAEGMQEG